MAKTRPPLYDQSAAPWGDDPYTIDSDKDTIGTSGCGPTALASMFTTLLGRVVLPSEMAKEALEHHDRTADLGTGWGFFQHMATQFKLKCIQTLNTALVLKEIVKPNTYVICSMKPGDFTKGGHFILLCDYNPKTGKCAINDSAGKAGKLRSSKLWDFKTIKAQCKQYWIISK